MTSLSLGAPNGQLSLLLVGDQPTGTRLIVDRAATAGWRTIICKDLRQARAMLDANATAEITAIIVDECAEAEDPCEVVAELSRRFPRVPILLITKSSSVRGPLDAIRAGASDFLRKPIEPDRLLHALRAATSRTWPHHHELESFAEKFVGEIEFPSMVGADPAFRRALAQAAMSARGHRNILLEGESGTGKDTLARAIHSASPRAKAPLKAFNVRAVSEADLESALFGHLRAAFIGAFQARQGLLQECDGATLLIDEVNRLPAAIQERLAEALANRRVRPIGSKHSFCSDVRVIAISNQPLDKLVLRGEFNKDLLESLSSTHVHLPPLRERAKDIPLIARHFLASFRDSSDLSGPALSDDALSLLCRFDWPGNIRQLQTVLFRAAAFSAAPALTIEDFAHISRLVNRGEELPAPANDPASGITLYAEDGHLRPMADIELDILRLAIGHYRGRMSEVARRLAIGRSTLYRKLAELGIESQ
jgi:DNA-binding NtrC family response regulator